jgi:GNAT superfamily N-acetyltransferase
MSETRSYPRHVKTDAGDIEFRLMSRADEAAVLAFAQKLPTHDLLFLPRNISQPKVLSAWINEIERGAIVSLLAVKAGAVVGCGTLVRDPHSWSPHVGEIRMVVSQDVRGQGVGRALSQETSDYQTRISGPLMDRIDARSKKRRCWGDSTGETLITVARAVTASDLILPPPRRARRRLLSRLAPAWKSCRCR